MSETVQVHKHAPEKVETIERVSKLAKKYPVLAITNLSKVRASQLMAVRKALRGHAEVFVVKNTLAILGLQKAGIENADQLLSHLAGQNALIFSTYDPFKLFLTLDKNKVYLPARAGDKAPDDIVVPAGNTSLPAGPVLSEFREAGIQTKIEGGSIWVNKDSVAVKKGGGDHPEAGEPPLEAQHQAHPRGARHRASIRERAHLRGRPGRDRPGGVQAEPSGCLHVVAGAGHRHRIRDQGDRTGYPGEGIQGSDERLHRGRDSRRGDSPYDIREGRGRSCRARSESQRERPAVDVVRLRAFTAA